MEPKRDELELAIADPIVPQVVALDAVALLIAIDWVIDGEASADEPE